MVKETELLLKPKPKKNKFQFLNSNYFRPMYNPDFKKLYGDKLCDFITIIYRDEETDEKKLKIIPNPEFQFFVANDDVKIDHHLSQIELSKVHIEAVPYKFLLEELCNIQDEWEGTKTDFTKYYRDGKKQKGTLYEANKFHKFNRIFSSDINIEDYYKGRFLDTYPEASNSKLTKAYTDIEVDSIDISGFPNEDDALCPINAITCFINENNTFYTLLLRNEKNPQIQKLEKDIPNFIKELKDFLGNEYEFKIKFFDDEKKMILYYFSLNNKFKPDFNLIWNMGFDIPYMLNRIGALSGWDRNDRERNHKYEFMQTCGELCSSKDFPDYLKVARYRKDRQNTKASEKIDTFTISSYTQWLDQLSLYASIRKGMGELESLSLSYVAGLELNDDKLNYTDSGSNIKTLPYDDYRKFVKYNIKDVYLLHKLEEKNNDVGLLNSIAEVTKTRLNKAMRKTVSLKNMAHHFYIDQGYVQGNNDNLTFHDGDEDELENGDLEKFAGQLASA